MERDKSIPIALFLTVLAVLPRMECQLRTRTISLPLLLPPPRPLCATQFSLVNYACAFLPYSPAPPISPPPPHNPPPKHPRPPPKHPHHDGGDDDDDDDDDNDNNNYNDDNEEHDHDHEHRHRHGNRHSSDEENCCRWLKEVDTECVCDLLVHLPVFLAKPVHEYTVVVDDTCSVTYTCNGRLRP